MSERRRLGQPDTIPYRLGEALTRNEAVAHAVSSSLPENILSLDLPAEKRLELTRTVHRAVSKYVNTLMSDKSLDDFEISLGFSHTLDPFTENPFPDENKEDLELLSEAFRDMPEGWGKRITLSQHSMALVQPSILPGVSLVSETSRLDGKFTGVRLVGKNKLPSGSPLT